MALTTGSADYYCAAETIGLVGDFGGPLNVATPIAAAHLQGAENVLLDQVWHSPRSPGVWYGSEAVIPLWAKYLVD